MSNYEIAHLEELREEEAESSQCGDTTELPHVNQVELHPYLAQRKLRAYCKDHGITVQGYSPFGSPEGKGELLSEALVLETASSLDCSPAQLMLLWAIQQGIPAIPMSTNEEHIQENMEVLSLFDGGERDTCTVRDVTATLSTLDRDQHFCWDPSNIR